MRRVRSSVNADGVNMGMEDELEVGVRYDFEGRMSRQVESVCGIAGGAQVQGGRLSTQ